MSAYQVLIAARSLIIFPATTSHILHTDTSVGIQPDMVVLKTTDAVLQQYDSVLDIIVYPETANF